MSEYLQTGGESSSEMRTCYLTRPTIAEYKPARNAVQQIISTLEANTVNIQLAEKGMETSSKEFFLPYLKTMLDSTPPSRAPMRDKLAMHDPCSEGTFICPLVVVWGRNGP